eukprot:TRINITY_DN13704_c0_g1_i1.p1 TRINITY_DN13704_c0_g1~~TRINITY_DN13704_c0_g1_i1.p1  ORF type:complete len:118 (+),score=7.34 TRINITY_DN13704_c0_g1_i1:72-425(+)
MTENSNERSQIIIDQRSKLTMTSKKTITGAFHPYKYPYDKEILRLHEAAVRLGPARPESKKCPCCANPTDLTYDVGEVSQLDVNDFNFLGQAYPLYFHLLRFCICLLYTSPSPRDQA